MPQLKLDEIEIEALQLAEWDRLHLAELLLASLDNDENVRDAWLAAAETQACDARPRIAGDEHEQGSSAA